LAGGGGQRAGESRRHQEELSSCRRARLCLQRLGCWSLAGQGQRGVLNARKRRARAGELRRKGRLKSSGVTLDHNVLNIVLGEL